MKQKSDAHLERRIVTGLILSTEFLEKITPLIKIKLLKSEESKRIANWCISHFNKYKKAPKKEIQNIYISKSESLDPDSASLIEETLNSLSKEFKKKKNTIDTDVLFDEAEIYLRKRQLQCLIDDAQEELDSGDLEEATQITTSFAPIQRITSNAVIPLSTAKGIREVYEDQFKPLFGYGDTPLGHMLNRTLCRGCFVSILAQNKGGKALRNSTPVLTDKGWKKIENMKIGDIIFNKQGNKKKVKGVHPQGLRKCYRFIFNDGTHIDSDKEHIWSLQTRTQRFDSRSPTYKNWINMTTDDIVNRYGLCIIENPQKRPLFPSCDSIKFKNKPVPVDPYIMGLLIGDGGFRGARPTITTVDLEIINAFNSMGYELVKTGKCNYYIKVKQEYVKIKQFRRKDGILIPDGIRFKEEPEECLRLKTHLKKLGLWNKKSIEKSIPKKYMFNSESVRLNVLQGLMDSDGTVSVCGKSITFSTSSKQLCIDVEFLARSLGAKVSTSTRVPKFTYKGKKRKGKRSYRVNIKTNIKMFKLKRKLKRQRIYRKTNERILYKIEEVGMHKTTCITTSDKDGLFITKDFIVTHNSFTLMDMGMRAVNAGCNVVYFQAGDMTQKQQERRQGIWLTRKSDMPEYCNTLYVPVLDCVYNQNGDCDYRDRESKFFPFENYTLEQIRGEADVNNIKVSELKERVSEIKNHKPCYNCIRSIDPKRNRMFKGCIWYKIRKPVNPLTWKDVYKKVKKGYHKKLSKMRMLTYPTDNLSISMIKQENDILKKQGFTADVMLIDYMDILAPDTDTKMLSTRDQENIKWKRARALSIIEDILIVAPTQADADSFNKKILQKKNFSEDKRKMDTVTGMFGINMTEMEKLKGIARYNDIVQREVEGSGIVHVLHRLQMGRPVLGSFY